ncbi:d-alanyl-D-alanine carboxypeptidase [Clostridium sp. CAG:356]|nr:d-alanyl-D-alanine carboxypeptidase [Clostridium sp. CAG:356]
MKEKISFFILLVIILCSISLPSFSINDYTWTVVNPAIEVSSADSETSMQDGNFLNLDSASAILIEQNSGQILYEHNIHEKLHPASVTKVMSLLLIMEALDSGKIFLDTQIPCSTNAANMGGSQIWLDTTETLSVNDMLKAIAVVSANDCVTAMAEYLGGTEENFVQMMNDKAKELGMNDTTFKNCHGLDEDEHLTSAYDIALMSRELLVKHPAITNYSTIWTDTLRGGKSALSNTNKLVRNYAGCTGLKTGSTSLALFNLSASATRDGLSLIAVIMKAPTSALRFSNAIKLLDYGFTNYSYKSFANRGDFIRQISVTKGIDSIANVVYETSPSFLVKKGEESKITYELNLPDTVSAPISKGQQLGTITYYSDGAKLDTVNLISDSTINKISFISMIKHISYNWLNLLRM